MSLSDNCWSQSHVNSISQLAPMYHNVLAQTSQVNLLQQQQQQQPNNQQPQPMQPQQYYCYPTNQQGSYNSNQYGQPYQQETFIAGQPQPQQQQQQQQQIPRSGVGSLGQPIGQTAYTLPSIMQSQSHGYGALPAHILDQIRPYIGAPAPIFILPSNCPSPVSAPQPAIVPGASLTQGCPGVGINCPSSGMCSPAGSYYPYPMAMPMFNPFVSGNDGNSKESKNCGCCSRRHPSSSENHNVTPSFSGNEPEEHYCVGGDDEVVCTKRNCPSAINLQALASQLLAIQGIIPCAATRLVLRRVAGSNITSSVEETIERARRSLNTLTQEQLLSETRQAQQVNALINLHMTANPPANVIPILTTVQLKVNLLKAHVDSSINRRLSESQGAEGNGNLDPMILALKSDQELRDLLGTLRQKECEERVNLNFAPYQSQRVIAECRLSNIQNKIGQLESEMERRRGGSALPRTSVAQQFSDPGWYGYTGDISNTSNSSGGAPVISNQNYESPDPFRFQGRSPKRLHLKPHVGSPETTYERPKKSSTARPSSRAARKDSDDEDCEDGAKNSGRDPSAENHRCACEKSSEDDSADEGKKKLEGKIVAGRDLGSMSEGDPQNRPGVSILKLSKNVVIVIDNPCGGTKRIEENGDVRGDLLKSKVKSEDKTESVEDSERPEEPQIKSSAGLMVKDSEKTTPTIVEKMKKFKWGKRREKSGDESEENKTVDPPQVEAPKFKTEVFFDLSEPAEDVKQERDDYPHDSDGPEPVREETVRMITKIDYEPSVFRAFLNPIDEPPEKDGSSDQRLRGSITEDSLRSSSMESNVDSNPTPESLSLHPDEFEDASSNPLPVSVDEERDNVETIPIAVVEKSARTEDEKIEQESSEIKGTINSNSRRIHRSGPSRHNDGNEEAACEKDEGGEGSLANKEGTEDDLISGALTTVGNHVASFGSLIGKIALKLHQVAESSETLFGDNSSSEPNEIDASVEDENEAEGENSAARNSMKTEAEMKKEVGKWKYIKFAELQDTLSANSTGESSNNSEMYALPKIKHSVIEDKNRGSKYVVIDEPSEELRRELGEPYRTGRRLVIRSRPKSLQSPSSEQSEPFTVVKSPKREDKNRLALHFVSPESSRKSRCNDSQDLKSSDKFWLRPESRGEQQIVERSQSREIVANEPRPETSKFVRTQPVNNVGKNAVTHSGTSVSDEHVVEIHEYSKTSVTPKKNYRTDTVVSSIA